MMANAPLKLDWNVILPGKDDAPPPVLEVVAARGGGEAAEVDSWTPENLSDQQLEEKLQRVGKSFSSGIVGKLPDKGAKLRRCLYQLQGEHDRRKLVAHQNKESVESEQSRRSRTTELSVSQNVPSSNHAKSEPRPQASFTSLFSQKIENKAGAESKESRCINQNKGIRSGKNEKRMHKERCPTRTYSQLAKMPTGRSQFRSASIFADKSKESSSKVDLWGTESCSISSRLRSNFSSHSPMKKRAFEVSVPFYLRSKKAKHVVFLDEEEVQPSPSVHNDAPDEWKEAKVYYPSRDDPESIELSYSDIKCLDPEKYITSPIMNFYMRYLQRPLSREGTRGGYYFFNTYFYNKLEEAMSCRDDRSACFSKLRRWWKGVNIFQKSYIFLPIHDHLHWSLVIICIPSKENESGPILLHLDSLRLHNRDLILDVVKNYLKDEWGYKNQHHPTQEVPISEWVWKNLPCRIEREMIMVPQQNNEYDCGLFVLYYMERFIQDAPERLTKEDLSKFDKGWFKPEDASGLRKRIRDLLAEEFENARFENGRTESPRSSSESPKSEREQAVESFR